MWGSCRQWCIQNQWAEGFQCTILAFWILEFSTFRQESRASDSICVSISLADRFLSLVRSDYYYLFTLDGPDNRDSAYANPRWYQLRLWSGLSGIWTFFNHSVDPEKLVLKLTLLSDPPSSGSLNSWWDNKSSFYTTKNECLQFKKKIKILFFKELGIK